MELYAEKYQLKKFPLRDFARKIGYTQSALSRILSSDQNPTDSFLRLASFRFSYDFKISYSVFEDGQALLHKNFRENYVNNRIRHRFCQKEVILTVLT